MATKPFLPVLSVLVGISLIAGACTSDHPLEPDGVGTASPAEIGSALSSPAWAASPNACWGQATKVFARTGVMGQHASAQPTPRIGLRNLARALYEAGIIPDDSLQSLGVFVADELGLSIEACI